MDILEILKELKEHNFAHFDDFYQMTNRVIYFTSLSILKDHGLAEDIVQDTYISFFTNLNDVKINNNIYAYLSTISRNLSINLYNKQKSIVGNDDVINQIPDNPNTNLDIENILNLLDDYVLREVVVYHVILDYKFIEIAKIMDKPLGTVLWLYNKGIKILKERIGGIL